MTKGDAATLIALYRQELKEAKNNHAGIQLQMAEANVTEGLIRQRDAAITVIARMTMLIERLSDPKIYRKMPSRHGNLAAAKDRLIDITNGDDHRRKIDVS